MSFIDPIISSTLVEALGWTILHSLWQGGVIGVLLYVLHVITRNRTAALRYNIALGALFLIISSFAVTFAYHYSRVSETATAVSETPAATAPGTGALVFMVQNAGQAASSDIASKLSPYLPLIVSLWMAGIALLSIRFIGGLIYVNRLKKKNATIIHELSETVNHLCYLLAVSRPVKVMESALVKVPVAIGYLKPVILLPAGLATGMGTAELEAILAHEIAHIRRNDFIINILQSLAEIVLFYHPAVYWINSVARRERENCCDDLAVSVSGSPLPLATALAQLEELNPGTPAFALAATGQGALLQRIKRMLVPGTAVFPSRPGAALVVIGILMIALAAFTPGKKKKEKDNTNEIYEVELPVVEIYTGDGDTLKGKKKEKKKSEKEVIIMKNSEGKTTDMYINGEKVPAEKIAAEEAKVAESEVIVLSEETGKKVAEDMRIHTDAMEQVAKEMEQVAKEMEKVAETMSKIDLPDPPEIPREMEELMEKHQEMMEKHEEMMRKHELELAKLEANMKPLEKEMRKHELKMQEQEKKMQEHEKAMQVYEERWNAFEKALEAELLADKLIKSKDKYMLKMERDALYINEKKQSPEVFEKYRQLLKKAMGEDVKETLDKDSSFTIIKN
jgi:bla regulator protein blaR1